MAEEVNQQANEVQLEGGTYEIIRKRLENHGKDLQDRLLKLNTDRKAIFGSVETKLLATDRIATDNNCIPRDMVPIGHQFIFGYNVHLGLKSEIDVKDVFSVYEFREADHAFHAIEPTLINHDKFTSDFKELYKYYKNTHYK